MNRARLSPTGSRFHKWVDSMSDGCFSDPASRSWRKNCIVVLSFCLAVSSHPSSLLLLHVADNSGTRRQASGQEETECKCSGLFSLFPANLSAHVTTVEHIIANLARYVSIRRCRLHHGNKHPCGSIKVRLFFSRMTEPTVNPCAKLGTFTVGVSAAMPLFTECHCPFLPARI